MLLSTISTGLPATLTKPQRAVHQARLLDLAARRLLRADVDRDGVRMQAGAAIAIGDDHGLVLRERTASAFSHDPTPVLREPFSRS